MSKKILFGIIMLLGLSPLLTAQYSQKIALLRYNGGGDWYANPTALVNLALYSNQNLNTSIDPEYEVVEVGSSDIYNYPFVHMTGHGNVILSDSDAKNLRKYLESGGFLHIDDNYGMDKFIRPELKKVFPNAELTPIPPTHQIFSQHYVLADGLPKIHEHDNKPPEAYGIFIKGRLVLFYTFESDLGDGWEDEEVHNDPPEIREQALQMGANIIQYVLNGEVKP